MIFKKDKFAKIFEQLDFLENKLWYGEKRIKWLEEKFGIKCHHDDLDYINDKVICKNCGKEWERHNTLSD